MKSDAGLIELDLLNLRAIAEPIYREATNVRFVMTLGDGWDVIEETTGDHAIFYIWMRIDFANGRHWFTRFKLPEILKDPGQWFREDADKLALAIPT